MYISIMYLAAADPGWIGALSSSSLSKSTTSTLDGVVLFVYSLYSVELFVYSLYGVELFVYSLDDVELLVYSLVDVFLLLFCCLNKESNENKTGTLISNAAHN